MTHLRSRVESEDWNQTFWPLVSALTHRVLFFIHLLYQKYLSCLIIVICEHLRPKQTLKLVYFGKVCDGNHPYLTFLKKFCMFLKFLVNFVLNTYPNSTKSKEVFLNCIAHQVTSSLES